MSGPSSQYSFNLRAFTDEKEGKAVEETGQTQELRCLCSFFGFVNQLINVLDYIVAMFVKTSIFTKAQAFAMAHLVGNQLCNKLEFDPTAFTCPQVQSEWALMWSGYHIRLMARSLLSRLYIN